MSSLSTSPIPQPELYWTKPTPHCPNSKLPVLVYRQVLPAEPTRDAVKEALEPNEWIEGGVFTHYPTAHFHSNTHECYAALRGSTKWVSRRGESFLPTRLLTGGGAACIRSLARAERETDILLSARSLYGVGPLDDPDAGVRFEMRAGDIAVHAAGVAHRNIESSADYEYAGLYPKEAPRWDNNFCKADRETTEAKAENARRVPIPDYDPIYGFDGPLPRIWKGIEAGGRA